MRLYEALHTPGLIDGLLYTKPPSMDRIVADIVLSRERWQTGKSYIFTIELKGQWIGRIGLGHRGGDPRWFLGYWLHPDSHGQGYMTESLDEILSFAFNSIHLSEIHADCHRWNKASKKVLERSGFEKIGEDEEKSYFTKTPLR